MSEPLSEIGDARVVDAGYFRSRFVPEAGRAATWRVVCRYLERFVPADARLLDLGAGYCSFVNHVRAAERHALDAYPGFVAFADAGVRTHVGSCTDLSAFAPRSLDVVFASNLLEHLGGEELEATLREVVRVLAPGGRFVLVQPNFRYCVREYFDDYTHRTVFTHVSLADLLRAHGFEIERVEPRFLPLSFKSRLPTWPWLVRLYLALPWRPKAGQMLVVGRRGTPDDPPWPRAAKDDAHVGR
ncbi:MAG: methyltransferase type 11 [Proteobacteria bacterium]|nr:MAG: methyltransferase type 11 [Pseudomonadota bacterium]